MTSELKEYKDLIDKDITEYSKILLDATGNDICRAPASGGKRRSACDCRADRLSGRRRSRNRSWAHPCEVPVPRKARQS